MTTAPQIRSQTFLGSFAVASGLNAAANGLAVGWALPDADGLQRAALLPLPSWPSSLQTAPLELDQPLLIGSELYPSLPSITGISAEDIDFTGTALSFDALSGEPTVVLQVSDATDPNFLSHIPSSVLLSLRDLQGLWPLSNGSIDADALGYAFVLPDEPISAIQYLPATAAGSSVQPLLVQSLVAAEGAVHNAYLFDQAADQLSYAWSPPNQQTAGSETGPDPASLSGEAVLIPSPAAGEPAVVMASMATQPTYGGLTPKGDQDILITGYTSEGVLLSQGEQVWAQLLGNAVGSAETPSPVPFPQLAFDPISRQLLVAGTLQGSLGTINPAFSSDVGIALASYGLDGSQLWERRIGDIGAGQQTIADLAVAPDGTVLVLGITSSSDGSGLYGQSPQGDGQDLDAFITAYSTAGKRLWTHQFGSTNNDWAQAMAFMPVADGQDQPNTLVVVGQQQPIGGEPQAWVELLEIPDLVDVAATALPPAALNLDWSVAGTDATTQLPRVMLQELVNPDGSREHQFTLSGQVDVVAGLSEVKVTLQANGLFTQDTRTAQVDQDTGEWSLAYSLAGLSEPAPAYLGVVFVEPVIPEGAPDSLLLPDAVQNPMLLVVSGTGLPGEDPQLLPLDPDGNSGPQQPVLLTRSLLRDGGGEITYDGQRLLVDYSGRLEDGTQFDSSLNSGRLPFELTLGAGSVITGWDQGLQGLPLDSQVQLVIPPELGYGSNATGSIPADSTLVFEVDLRADLSAPEAFLDPVLDFSSLNLQLINYFRSIDQWWQTYEFWKPDVSAYDQYLLNQYQLRREQQLYPDVLDLALQLGPGDGSDADDVISIPTGFNPASQISNVFLSLQLPPEYVPPPPLSLPELDAFLEGDEAITALEEALPLLGRQLPRLALAGLGDDQLQTLTQAAVLFGESGNDQIISVASDFAVLDGGAGDDVFTLGSGDALVLGGPGRDVIATPLAASGTQWLDYDSDDPDLITFGTTTYGVLRRQDEVTGEDVQRIYFSDVEIWTQDLEQIELFAVQHQAADLLEAVQQSAVPLQLATDSTVSVASAAELLQLELASSSSTLLGWDNVNLVLTGTASQLQQFLDDYSEDFSDLSGSLKLKLIDSQLSAVEMLQLASTSSFAIDTSSLQLLSGSYLDLQALLDHSPNLVADFPASLDIKLSDLQLAAADLLQLRSASAVAFDASSVQVLLGSEAERQQVFQDSKITIPPSARWQSVPADGVFGVGDSLEFVLAFDQPMQWSGSSDQLPSLQLSDGLTVELDLEASSMATGTLVFRHQVVAGESADDLTIPSDALLLSDPSQLTNSAGDMISGIEAFDAAVEIDGVLPTVSLSVPGRVYRPGEIIHYSLEFSEPVRWQADLGTSATPSLQLSDGLNAAPSSRSDSSVFSNTHDFDVLIGENLSRVDQLQVDHLLGAGQFVDQAGNALVMPSQQQLAVRNAPDVSSHHWNLDIDGDGSLSPFRDGILIMKYLINPSATPQDLVSGMLLDPASRSPQQIYDYLVLGSQEGFLDVDRSGGDPSLFTDGIILLKHLIGFPPGASLVQGLLGAESGFIPLNVETGFLLQPNTLSQADLSEIGEEVGGLLVALMG